ncbi:hypothetical protein HYC85_017935 [Camellia sinensis]|uniref:GDSL esterase/lipase n=1 Tax=Camellia sinensis TaxID=4442 RepID=A0A7J7GWS9_CAMSI|nr:hypothetical protein HYC85_017935 [Camellia sinensis]
MKPQHKHLLLLTLLFIVSVSLFMSKPSRAQTLTKQTALNHSISAVFVFGDSTVDPGNNNYIETVFKSNFPPYGKDFPNHIATGRFTNGRLVTDYMASYVGIKANVPPYLDSTLSMEELMTGVSFASAASGFDPLTPQISGVISMTKQMEYFREYKSRLEIGIGRKRTQNLIKNAAFLISAGTNDFVVNYFGPPVRRQSYTVLSYQQFLIQQLLHFIQDLGDQGARKIAIVGLPPMGCLPAVITLYSNDLFHGRGCIESLSSIARDYNRMLQNELLKVMTVGGPLIAYGDIYTPLIDMIQGRKYGFEEVNTGCCGTGFLEASLLCNPKSIVCPDATKHVFWDSIHPTEKTYSIIFNSFRSTIDYVIGL